MIETIIVGALGMAFVGILNGTNTVNQSLSRSGDARIAAAYIISDARNSSGPEISLLASTCSDPNPPVVGTSKLIVGLGWLGTTSATANATTTHVVDYILVSNSLLRRECKGGVLVSDRVVASERVGRRRRVLAHGRLHRLADVDHRDRHRDARRFRCELHVRAHRNVPKADRGRQAVYRRPDPARRREMWRRGRDQPLGLGQDARVRRRISQHQGRRQQLRCHHPFRGR